MADIEFGGLTYSDSPRHATELPLGQFASTDAAMRCVEILWLLGINRGTPMLIETTFIEVTFPERKVRIPAFALENLLPSTLKRMIETERARRDTPSEEAIKAQIDAVFGWSQVRLVRDVMFSLDSLRGALDDSTQRVRDFIQAWEDAE